ncbi:MAG: hypothetical protein OEZ08_00820 [Betaproteobacteria bacterium]|nr:hypothetical protein [Betaproteobacteria bacterium]
MDVIHDDYQVQFDEASSTVRCQGSFRLHGDEYKPILDLLINAADMKPATLTLDVRELQFLNSSGINTLSKFILQVRKHQVSQVVVRGSTRFPWQEKSLINLQRLLPELKLAIE